MTPPMNTLLFVACGSTILSFLTTCEEKKKLLLQLYLGNAVHAYEAIVIKVTGHLLLIWLRLYCLQTELERNNNVQHDEANRSGAYNESKKPPWTAREPR